MRPNLVLLNFIVGIFIGLSAVIGPAAAVQNDSGGYNNHCFQYLSEGPCFIPNPNPPTSTSCFDLNLELVLKNHVESKNSTPANAYWELADATFLGDVFTYRVNKKVALCHTGPLPTGRYYSTCRETVRDNDWDEAKYQPSCSIFHDNGKPLRGSGCVVPKPQASDKDLSRLDIALAVVAFTSAPPAYIQYYKDGRRFWRHLHAQPGDLELGEAPNRRLFHRAVELGIVVIVWVQGLFNLVADYLGHLPDVIQGIFNHDHVVAAALAHPAALGG